MTSDRTRDLAFVAGLLGLSGLVLGWLLLDPPFGEPRSDLGAGWGWGLAVVAIVPSYVLLSRAMADDNPHRFQRAFLLGTMGRFLVSLLGTVAFWVSIEDAPIKIFLLAFGLGWLLLTGLELGLVLKPQRAKAATPAAPQGASAAVSSALNHEEHA